MDLTPIYILQCEKAIELQHDPIDHGDYYSSRRLLYVFHFAEYEITGDYLRPKIEIYHGIDEIRKYYIKVFRQDQLQDMVTGKIDAWPTGVIGLRNLAIFAEDHDWDSMEQLWLGFVMFHLYHKVWHNDTWEIADD